jgi:hypothetical protein
VTAGSVSPKHQGGAAPERLPQLAEVVQNDGGPEALATTTSLDESPALQPSADASSDAQEDAPPQTTSPAVSPRAAESSRAAGPLRRLSISLGSALSSLDQRSPKSSDVDEQASAVGAVEEVAPPIQYRVVAPGAVREGPELESVKIAQLAVGDVITVHQHAPLSGGAYRAWRVHFTREGSSLSGWASTSTKKGTQLLELMNADKVAAAKMEVLMAQQQEEEEEEEEEQEEESAAPEPEAESELPAEDADAAPDEEVQSAVAAWLAERGHEGTSEVVCESLRDAEIAPAEWLAELAEIEQSGQLAEFIASEVKAWEAAEVEAQAEAQAEAEAALARQRAAASMRAAAQAVAVREEAATKLQASARGMAVRRTRRQALAADDTVQAEADVQQQPPSPHPPGTRSTAADAAPPHQGMAWYRVLNFGAIRAGVALSSPKVGATVVGESILVTQRVVHEDGTVRLQFERGWVSEHGRKGTKLLEFVRETGAPLAAQQALQERVESALEKQSERLTTLPEEEPAASSSKPTISPRATSRKRLEEEKQAARAAMKMAGVTMAHDGRRPSIVAVQGSSQIPDDIRSDSAAAAAAAAPAADATAPPAIMSSTVQEGVTDTPQAGRPSASSASASTAKPTEEEMDSRGETAHQKNVSTPLATTMQAAQMSPGSVVQLSQFEALVRTVAEQSALTAQLQKERDTQHQAHFEETAAMAKQLRLAQEERARLEDSLREHLAARLAHEGELAAARTASATAAAAAAASQIEADASATAALMKAEAEAEAARLAATAAEDARKAMQLKTEAEMASSMQAEAMAVQQATAQRMAAEHAHLQRELAEARLEVQQHVRGGAGRLWLWLWLWRLSAHCSLRLLLRWTHCMASLMADTCVGMCAGGSSQRGRQAAAGAAGSFRAAARRCHPDGGRTAAGQPAGWPGGRAAVAPAANRHKHRRHGQRWRCGQAGWRGGGGGGGCRTAGAGRCGSSLLLLQSARPCILILHTLHLPHAGCCAPEPASERARGRGPCPSTDRSVGNARVVVRA